MCPGQCLASQEGKNELLRSFQSPISADVWAGVLRQAMEREAESGEVASVSNRGFAVTAMVALSAVPPVTLIAKGWAMKKGRRLQSRK